MAATQAAENYRNELGLTCYLRWGIYNSIPTWTHSQNLIASAEALSLKISSHKTSLKWSQRPSQSEPAGDILGLIEQGYTDFGCPN